MLSRLDRLGVALGVAGGLALALLVSWSQWRQVRYVRVEMDDLEIQVRKILVAEGGKLSVLPLNEKVALMVSLYHFS